MDIIGYCTIHFQDLALILLNQLCLQLGLFKSSLIFGRVLFDHKIDSTGKLKPHFNHQSINFKTDFRFPHVSRLKPLPPFAQELHAGAATQGWDSSGRLQTVPQAGCLGRTPHFHEISGEACTSAHHHLADRSTLHSHFPLFICHE